VVEPLRDLFARKGLLLIPILLLVGLFRLPDFVAGVMANPLYIDLGFSKTDIANVSKLYGVWIGIIGAFGGGLALTRAGLWPTLLVGAVVAAASNLMFAWLAVAGNRLDLLTLAISIDNFAAGFAGSALIAYMSGLTSPSFAATQYALLSSLYALPGKFIGGFSGAVVDHWGYPVLFTATAAIGIPLVILCLVVRRDTIAAEEGGGDIHSGAAPAAAPSRA
jgi:MFS transporter, PAT family, beta-lactamase induction signal transducer AmpG